MKKPAAAAESKAVEAELSEVVRTWPGDRLDSSAAQFLKRVGTQCSKITMQRDYRQIVVGLITVLATLLLARVGTLSTLLAGKVGSASKLGFDWSSERGAAARDV